MYKPKKNKLLELISSLSPTEKRYISLFLEPIKQKDSKYLSVFQELCQILKLKNASKEDLFKKILSKHIDPTRYHQFKSILFTKILNALIEFHRESDVKLQLKHILSQAETLSYKGLPDQALKYIEKGKKLAQKFEQWYHLLTFVELKNSIEYSLQKIPTSQTFQQSIVKKSSNLQQFKNLQGNMWQLYLERGLPSNEIELKLYTDIISDPLLKNQDQALSYQAKSIFLYLFQFYYGMEENLSKTCEFGIKLIEHLELKPYFIKESCDMYLRAHINLQFAYLRLKKYEEILKSSKQCRKVIQSSKGNQGLKASIGLSLFINEIESLYNLNTDKDFSIIINEMRKHYNQNSNLLSEPSKYIYFFHNAIYHFNNKEYEQTLFWLNKIQLLKSGFREDIQTLSRILLLIVHFELGNRTYLKHCIKSTLRFLKKKRHLFALEKLIVDFIKKQNKKMFQSKKELRNSFMLLKDNLNELTKKSTSHNAFRSINFERWIDNNIN